jgi:hypothetical protein
MKWMKKFENLGNFFKLDGLGKVTFQQNGNSIPLWRWAYSPWGEGN